MSMSMSRVGVHVLLIVAALQLQAHGHDLSPNIELVSTSNNAAAECKYSFQVQTGTIHGAGTDAKITFVLNPAKGNGFKHVVDAGGPPYEVGSLDKFSVPKPCMMPCSLSLSVNNEGEYPDWFPEYVYIKVSGEITANVMFDVEEWVVFDAEPIVINQCGNAKAAVA